MPSLDGPQIIINDSPQMDLRIKCVRAQRVYGSLVDHRFEVKCTIRHPSGHFEYTASDLWLDIESFSRFVEELLGAQQGTHTGATLKNVGEMFELHLARDGMGFRT